MRHTDVVQQKAMKDGSGGIGKEFSSLELIWHKLGLEKEQLIGGRWVAPNVCSYDLVRYELNKQASSSGPKRVLYLLHIVFREIIFSYLLPFASFHGVYFSEISLLTLLTQRFRKCLPNLKNPLLIWVLVLKVVLSLLCKPLVEYVVHISV